MDKQNKTPPQEKGWKERLYDHLRMPLWLLDTIIVLLLLAIVVLMIVGTRP